MDIKTLENGDRLLTLSAYERDTLIEVATYLRDNYDDLEFSIRNFTPEQVNDVMAMLENFDVTQPNRFSEEDVEACETVFSEVNHLIESLILEEKEHWEDVSYELFRLTFYNLGTDKLYQGVKK